MSVKGKQFAAYTLAASIGAASAAAAGYFSYQSAVSYTDTRLADVQTQSKKAADYDRDAFEKRVETALESIVAKRQATKKSTAKASTGNESQLSMNDEGQVVYGNPDAALTIYTFSDFRCSYCTKFDPLVESVVDQSGGEVNFIYKPYPVLGPASQSLAKAGECIAQEEGPEAFWRYAELAYQTKNWITAIAQSNLSDPQNIKSCIEQNRYGKRITGSLDEGQELGITGTPSSVFRNNETGQGAFIPGFIDENQIKQMLEEIK